MMDDLRPTICVDLDEVVWDWLRPFLSFARDRQEKFGHSFPNDLRRWTNWNGYLNYGISKEQFLILYQEFCLAGKFADLPYIKGAKKNLNKIGDKAKIVFVTMRPPSVMADTIKCFMLNGIVNWHSLIHIVSDLPGSLGNEEVSLQYIKGHGTIEVPQFKSKMDVFKHFAPTMVFDDKPEYIEQAIEVGIPHVVIVARLHNVRWRRENLSMTNMLRGGAPLSFKVKNSTVYMMYPDWNTINILMGLTNYGQADYRIEWKEGFGEGYSVPVAPEQIGPR